MAQFEVKIPLIAHSENTALTSTQKRYVVSRLCTFNFNS